MAAAGGAEVRPELGRALPTMAPPPVPSDGRARGVPVAGGRSNLKG